MSAVFDDVAATTNEALVVSTSFTLNGITAEVCPLHASLILAGVDTVGALFATSAGVVVITSVPLYVQVFIVKPV